MISEEDVPTERLTQNPTLPEIKI